MIESRNEILEGDIPKWGEDAFVVAPCCGRVDIDDELSRPGAVVYSGAVVGRIIQNRSTKVIVSRFTGTVEKPLVETGARVRAGRPVLWLRRT